MKKRILIVEDERVIAEDIKRSLKHFGYEVLNIVSTGRDAIDKTHELKPDLILMDIILEGKMNGVQAAEQITKTFKIPIVYLTAYADYKTIQIAKVTGPFGYILKPYEEKELHTTIEMAFYKHKMERAIEDREEFMRHVIDTDPNIIFVKDNNCKYVMVNRSMAELYGTTPEAMLGKTDLELAELSKLKIRDANKYREEDERVLISKKTLLVQEHQFVKNDGEKRWFQTTKVPLSLKFVPDGILGVSVDISARKKAEDELLLSYKKLQRLLEETVNGLVSAVEIRDPYTAGHQRRVSVLAEAIAMEMDLQKDQIDGIRMAALIHDIGKIYVPAEILSKPGKLSEAEFNLIKIHPQAGHDILSSIEFPWPVAKIVLQHQERLDGSSYPQGLKGDEIIIEAKILGVADTIEAMASHRPYRPALGIDEALKEISSKRGLLYDPSVVDACLKLFNEGKFKF